MQPLELLVPLYNSIYLLSLASLMPVRRLNSAITLFLVFSAWLLLSPASAAALNGTIDDSFGDSVTGQKVSYSPTSDTWDNRSCGSKCFLHPDVWQAFKGTYTAGTHYPPDFGPISITMQFTGTAIYVFFIFANNNDPGGDTTTLTAANFTLDRTSPQLYQHDPDLTNTDFEYNQLVFKQENLDNTNHTLVVSASGPTKAFIAFDYAIYTFEDDTTPTTSNSLRPSNAIQISSSAATTVATTTPSSIHISSSTTSIILSTATTSTMGLGQSGGTSDSTPSPTLVSGTSSTIRGIATTSAVAELGQSGGNSQIRVSISILIGVIGGLAIVVPIIFIVFRLRRNRPESTEEGQHFFYFMKKFRFKRGKKVNGITSFTLRPISSSTTHLTGRDSNPSTPDTNTTTLITLPSSPRSRRSLGGHGTTSRYPLDSEHDRSLGPAQRMCSGQDCQTSNSEDLREQVNALREQIAYMQTLQRSSELLGSTLDDPPPY